MLRFIIFIIFIKLFYFGYFDIEVLKKMGNIVYDILNMFNR